MITIGVAAHNCLPYTVDTVAGMKYCFDEPDTQVVFVDDNSNDETFEYLTSLRNANIQVIRHDTNMGAPCSWNEIVEIAEANNSEYVYILNNDLIVGYDWFNKMSKFFQANPKCGVASSEVIDIQYPAEKIKKNWQAWEDWTSSYGAANAAKTDVGCHFCCFGITRKCWQEIGTFDEGFIRTSYEDTDYALRAERAGFDVLTTHSAIAMHYGGITQHDLTVKEGGNQFQQLNRQYFQQKWNVQLDGSICSRGIFWEKEDEKNWKRRIPI